MLSAAGWAIREAESILEINTEEDYQGYQGVLLRSAFAEGKKAEFGRRQCWAAMQSQGRPQLTTWEASNQGGSFADFKN